jgi:hypothetical protein
VTPSPFDVFRFRSIGDAVGRALNVDPSPECRIENGRTTLTFRRLGASRWSENEQMHLARRAVAVARAALGDDSRGKLRRGATKAITIVYKDTTVVQGCEVVSRWECTVPGDA